MHTADDLINIIILLYDIDLVASAQRYVRIEV